jgi:hypothetical protein
MPCKYKCENCNRRYCDSFDCGKNIYYHIDSDSVHDNTGIYYFKCCNSCCSQCYLEICSICGDIESNLDMIILDGVYQCKTHI